MQNKWRLKNIKLFFIKLAKARNTVNEIALGMGIGTFISVFPTFGFGTLLVLFLNRFIKFNLVAALAASLISNPFTSPFFLIFSFKVGSVILGIDMVFSLENWKENLADTGLVMLLGSFIVSGSSAVIAFLITRWLVLMYRSSKKRA